MEALREALGTLYEEFEKEKIHYNVLLRLSQILDEYVAKEQKRRYEIIRKR